MFYCFTFMCKSLQIFGWRGTFSVPPPPFGIQFEKKVRCVIAKTKPQYQSDKKTDKERPFCVYFERKSGLKARERLSIYF